MIVQEHLAVGRDPGRARAAMDPKTGQEIPRPPPPTPPPIPPIAADEVLPPFWRRRHVIIGTAVVVAAVGGVVLFRTVRSLRSSLRVLDEEAR